MTATTVLALLCAAAPSATPCAAAPSARQESGPARAVEAAYPAERHATTLHYFALGGEVDGQALERAVAALDAEGRARIVAGPASCSTRPKRRFLALEAPAELQPKALIGALRRASGEIEALAATSFETSEGALPGILAYSARECVVGMADEMRWFEERDGRRTFWFVSGKLAADDLAKRFRRLYEPFGHPDVGRLVEHPLEWTLAAPVDAAAAKKAERAIAKLPGVLSARIDAAAGTLEARLAIDGVRQSLAGGGEGLPSRLRWPTNALLDVLAEHGLAPPGADGPAKGRGATPGKR